MKWGSCSRVVFIGTSLVRVDAAGLAVTQPLSPYDRIPVRFVRLQHVLYGQSGSLGACLPRSGFVEQKAQADGQKHRFVVLLSSCTFLSPPSRSIPIPSLFHISPMGGVDDDARLLEP
jgi:hypothetical protein